MVREVLTDQATGLATGVSYVDTKTMAEVSVRAKRVVLGASACESARLLLNSKSARFPQGLANTSGVIGKYLNRDIIIKNAPCRDYNNNIYSINKGYIIHEYLLKEHAIKHIINLKEHEQLFNIINELI